MTNQVGNIGSGTLIWKKDNRIISAGPVVIRKDKRFGLEGTNLTMSLVQVGTDHCTDQVSLLSHSAR